MHGSNGYGWLLGAPKVCCMSCGNDTFQQCLPMPRWGQNTGGLGDRKVGRLWISKVFFFFSKSTLPKTNSSYRKIGHPKRKVVFRLSTLHFQVKLLVSGRVLFFVSHLIFVQWDDDAIWLSHNCHRFVNWVSFFGYLGSKGHFREGLSTRWFHIRKECDKTLLPVSLGLNNVWKIATVYRLYHRFTRWYCPEDKVCLPAFHGFLSRADQLDSRGVEQEATWLARWESYQTPKNRHWMFVSCFCTWSIVILQIAEHMLPASKALICTNAWGPKHLA